MLFDFLRSVMPYKLFENLNCLVIFFKLVKVRGNLTTGTLSSGSGNVLPIGVRNRLIRTRPMKVIVPQAVSGGPSIS